MVICTRIQFNQTGISGANKESLMTEITQPQAGITAKLVYLCLVLALFAGAFTLKLPEQQWLQLPESETDRSEERRVGKECK